MHVLKVKTTQRNQILDITRSLQALLEKEKFRDGLAVVHCPHTTAALTVNENADPDVKSDMLGHLSKMIPRDPAFAHSEANADSHIKATLVGISQTFLVEDGWLLLGTWQGLYFMEFDGPRDREVWVKLIGG
jgi:secondary thiamine-phosphate synthase enzyme